MISADRNALFCDLAETYGIYDWKGLPVSTLAALSVGLRADSRIKMRLSGARATRTEILLAAAVDKLSWLCWAQTENGRNNVCRPRSILSILLGESEQESDVVAFESTDDFEATWAQITGVNHGEE